MSIDLTDESDNAPIAGPSDPAALSDAETPANLLNTTNSSRARAFSSVARHFRRTASADPVARRNLKELALAEVLNRASRARADAQDATELLEALHRAENEGWRVHSPPIDHLCRTATHLP